MIGIFYREDLLQKWFDRNLHIARQVLKEFSTINHLLDGFKGYETKRYRDMRNAVMFLCLPSIINGIDPKSLVRLHNLETALESFKITQWGGERLKHLKSRFGSEDYITSLSVITEFEVAYYLGERLGMDHVSLYPKLASGGFPDIRARIDKKEVYFEVGNLGETIPEDKIQSILEGAARYLGNKIEGNHYISLDIDTAELVFDQKGNIDVGASIQRLNTEIDILAIHQMVGFEERKPILLDLSELEFIIKNKKLLMQYSWPDGTQEKELLDLITKNSIIKNWLASIHDEDFEKIRLIKNIISGKTSTLLVEIHTIGSFPSRSGSLERESFMNHVCRNVEGQISEEQLQPDAPNIVVVQGSHWTFGMNYDLFGIQPLVDRIKQFLSHEKNGYLSGIILFANTLENGLYINNSYAMDNSSLMMTEVERFGLKATRIF